MQYTEEPGGVSGAHPRPRDVRRSACIQVPAMGSGLIRRDPELDVRDESRGGFPQGSGSTGEVAFPLLNALPVTPSIPLFWPHPGCGVNSTVSSCLPQTGMQVEDVSAAALGTTWAARRRRARRSARRCGRSRQRDQEDAAQSSRYGAAAAELMLVAPGVRGSAAMVRCTPTAGRRRGCWVGTAVNRSDSLQWHSWARVTCAVRHVCSGISAAVWSSAAALQPCGAKPCSRQRVRSSTRRVCSSTR
eukprot:gene3668-biopygen17258